MAEIVAAYNPWDLGVYRIENTLVRPWVLGYKKHVNLEHAWKYLDLDLAAAEGGQVMTSPRRCAARDSRSLRRRRKAVRPIAAPASRRNIVSHHQPRSKQGPMFDARNFIPLPSAFAAGTVARVGGSLLSHRALGHDAPHRPVPDLPRRHAVIAWPEFPPGSRRDPVPSQHPPVLCVFSPRLAARSGIAGDEAGSTMLTLQRKFGRLFHGLWRNPEFMKLWTSLTITSFGAQITNLALPLTAAVLLHATPWQMGVLVALETLPFALVSLHAGVLIDRVRKLPIVIAADIGRGVALLAIPVAAYFGALSIEILFVVGFLCGMQNVVGGAAYQVLLAQMAGRSRLVEANAKIALGETSAALVGPGLAGGLIQLVTAPFAIAPRRADVLRLGADAAAHPRAARRARSRPAAVGDLRDPRGAEARLEQPDAAGARVARRALADPAPHAGRRADPVRDARARPVRGCDRAHVRVRRASAACSRPRSRSGCPRASASVRSSCTGSR